ncbi:DUF4142 domain-containing protein [Actinoplanes sp. CA-252034]|uniref:DUF4142 domain-containing protein n=1 Tax=Actinoplanes sp. CA-252034 TaxID=3239906 RepID=UPI003D99D164
MVAVAAAVSVAAPVFVAAVGAIAWAASPALAVSAASPALAASGTSAVSGALAPSGAGAAFGTSTVSGASAASGGWAAGDPLAEHGLRAAARPALAVPGPATAAVDPSTQDTAFLQAANEINLAGIAQGRIAWTKTKNAEVKEIAGRFMVDHIRLNAEVTEAARKLKIKLSISPNAEQLALAERYQAASAGSFDALYLSTQLELQQEAKRITDTQVAKGSDVSIKQVAAAASPILAGHQQMLKEAAR